MDLGRALRLVLIGIVAGAFSSLLGVGGGIVMVPLLVTLLAYDAKQATATSLAAILFTATAGAIAFGALGNVDVSKALLIGLPALVGVTIGLGLKERLSTTVLTYAFCALLVVVAVRLVLL